MSELIQSLSQAVLYYLYLVVILSIFFTAVVFIFGNRTYYQKQKNPLFKKKYLLH